MSIAACAEIVQRGDPDRFMATMAAPVVARAVLFPIYAFNVEVARAPWVSPEPMIGQMRLQWWRDVIAEVQTDAPARAHEVVTPLAEVARTTPLPLVALDDVAFAHATLADEGGLDSPEALDSFMQATGAGLMWAAAASLGAPSGLEPTVRAYGWASGIAAYLRSVPALEARGLRPLPDGRPDAVKDLALRGLEALKTGRTLRGSRATHPALLAGWRAAATLRKASRMPHLVSEGALEESEFEKRGTLLWCALTRRF